MAQTVYIPEEGPLFFYDDYSEAELGNIAQSIDFQPPITSIKPILNLRFQKIKENPYQEGAIINDVIFDTGAAISCIQILCSKKKIDVQNGNDKNDNVDIGMKFWEKLRNFDIRFNKFKDIFFIYNGSWLPLYTASKTRVICPVADVFCKIKIRSNMTLPSDFILIKFALIPIWVGEEDAKKRTSLIAKGEFDITGIEKVFLSITGLTNLFMSTDYDIKFCIKSPEEKKITSKKKIFTFGVESKL